MQKSEDDRPPQIICPDDPRYGWYHPKEKLSHEKTKDVKHKSQDTAGTTYIPDPTVTLFQNISDSEVPADLAELHWVKNIRQQDPRLASASPDMIAFKLRNWNVSVMIYSQPFKMDGIHSATIAKCGVWDDGTVKALCDAYNKHGARGAMLDIGGNIGAYTMPLAKCLKDAGSSSEVITIEADPANTRHLRTGMKHNNLDNIHLYEYAVGAGREENSVTMRQGMFNHGMPHVVEENADVDTPGGVPVTTIDAILLQEAIQKEPSQASRKPKGVFAMKMDIEGYEPQALRGAFHFLKNHAPCIINIEMKTSGDESEPFLLTLGYIKKEPHPDPYNAVDAWYEREDFDACVSALDKLS